METVSISLLKILCTRSDTAMLWPYLIAILHNLLLQIMQSYRLTSNKFETTAASTCTLLPGELRKPWLSFHIQHVCRFAKLVLQTASEVIPECFIWSWSELYCHCWSPWRDEAHLQRFQTALDSLSQQHESLRAPSSAALCRKHPVRPHA